MALDITAALRDGLDRTFARNGLLLMAVFLVLGTVNEVASQTLTRQNRALLQEIMPPDVQTVPGFSEFLDVATPWALPIGWGGAVGLTIIVAVIAEAVRIVAVRTLVSDETETVPDEFRRRRLAWATINGVVGGIIVLVLVGIGLVLLVIPGLFLAVSFFFVRQEIAVEDKNAIDAMADSWALTAGNRIELFALAVIVVVIGVIASILGGVAGVFGQTISSVVSVAIGAGIAVFGIAVAARAYDQLRIERAERLGREHP